MSSFGGFKQQGCAGHRVYGLRRSRLEAKWTDEIGERTSLRDLADEFNKMVLKVAISDAAGVTISSDLESTYAVLSDNEGSSAERIRKQRELERQGIDVEQVLDDFVTHQTIYTSHQIP